MAVELFEGRINREPRLSKDGGGHTLQQCMEMFCPAFTSGAGYGSYPADVAYFPSNGNMLITIPGVDMCLSIHADGRMEFTESAA